MLNTVEMQIKTTVRHHFTPTRMAIKKKNKKQRNIRVGEDGETGTLIRSW